MRNLPAIIAGAGLLAASATVILPSQAGAVPVVTPAAIAPNALPVEKTFYYGGRLCFYRFGWHGPGLYHCRHHWWGGYGYGWGGYGWHHRWWHGGYGWHGYGWHGGYGWHRGWRGGRFGGGFRRGGFGGGFHGGGFRRGGFGGGFHGGGFHGGGFHGGGFHGGGRHR